jgi:glucose/arabinose dehydrogenase
MLQDRLPIDEKGERFAWYRGKAHPGQTLVNRTLISDLLAMPGPYHNGGKLIISPDGDLYIVIGSLGSPNTRAQNNKTGPRLPQREGY